VPIRSVVAKKQGLTGEEQKGKRLGGVKSKRTRGWYLRRVRLGDFPERKEKTRAMPKSEGSRV